MIVDTDVLPVLTQLEYLLVVYVRMGNMTTKEQFVKLVSLNVNCVTTKMSVLNVLIQVDLYLIVNVLKDNSKSIMQPVRNVMFTVKLVLMIKIVPVALIHKPLLSMVTVFVLKVLGWMNMDIAINVIILVQNV